MMNIVISTILLLLISATSTSAHLSLLRVRAPTHTQKHTAAPHFEFGQSLHGEAFAAVLRELSGEDPFSMPILSMSMLFGTATATTPAPTSAPMSSSDNSAPMSPLDSTSTFTFTSTSTSTSTPTSTSTSTLDPDADANANDGAGADATRDVAIPEIQGNNSSSSAGVSPAKTAVIALAMCCALAAGMVAFHRVSGLRSRSRSSSGSVSSGSGASSSESADSSSDSASDSAASGSAISFV